KLNSAINRTPYIGSDSLQRKARKANKDKYRQEKFQRAVSGNLNPEESSRLKRRLGMWSAGVGIKDLARGEVKENTPEAAAITRFVSESDEIKRRERKEQYQVHTNNLVGDDLEVYQNLIVMQQLFRDMHGIEDGRKFTDVEQRSFIDFYNGAVDPRHQVDEDRIRRITKAARIKFDDFMSLDGNLSIEVLDKMFEGKKVDSIKALNNAMIQDPSAGGIGFNIKHPPSLSENQVGALFADMSLGKYRGWAKENMGQMIGYGADKLTATEFLEQKKQGYDMMAERIEAETDPAKKAKLVNDFVKAAEKAASDPKAVSAGYTDEKGKHIIATLGRIHASPADIDSFKTKLENTQQGLPQSSSPVSPSSYMTLDIQERISRGEGGMYSAVGTPGITMQERVNTVVSTAQAINNPYLRDSANATQLSKGVARQAAALIETTSPAGIKGQMTQAEFVTRHGGAFSTPAEAIDAYDQLSSVIASMDVDRSRTTGDIVDAKFRV
ncbi:hypothetical protein KC853_03260, partial [Candidatus Saccharibacteria bacterium]|nr:hypothetical protein [Candidatus Saccharibacteria bacterium]